LNFLLKLFAFAACSLIIGFGSAWYFIDNGPRFSTAVIGPWQIWLDQGKADAEPYTRAHMARTGQLPVTSANALYFTASTDSDGSTLYPSCDYEITGRAYNALWWSLAAYDAEGQPIPNKAGRHAFSSKNIAVLPNGTFVVRLAPNTRPGNWLPSGNGGGIVLLLSVIRPANAPVSGMQRSHGDELPRIRRVSC
jgi:hypothetical protein